MSPHHSEQTDRTLSVHLLGTVDFDAATALQEYLIYQMSGEEGTSGALLLCEHPTIVTLGRGASIADLRCEREHLRQRNIPLRWVSRGGGAYAHGPGQLVAYLLLPIERLGLGVSEFRKKFETAMVETCHELKIPAKRDDTELGVWGRNGHLAYFGAAVRSGVTCHGMFLNVSPKVDILSLTNTNPTGDAATSVQAQHLGPHAMSSVREMLMRHVSEQFEYANLDVATGHPLLKRTYQRVYSNA